MTSVNKYVVNKKKGRHTKIIVVEFNHRNDRSLNVNCAVRQFY